MARAKLPFLNPISHWFLQLLPKCVPAFLRLLTPLSSPGHPHGPLSSQIVPTCVGYAAFAPPPPILHPPVSREASAFKPRHLALAPGLAAGEKWPQAFPGHLRFRFRRGVRSGVAFRLGQVPLRSPSGSPAPCSRLSLGSQIPIFLPCSFRPRCGTAAHCIWSLGASTSLVAPSPCLKHPLH